MQPERRILTAPTQPIAWLASGRPVAQHAASLPLTARTIFAVTLVIAAIGTGAAVSWGSVPGHPIDPHSGHVHSAVSVPRPIPKPPWMF